MPVQKQLEDRSGYRENLLRRSVAAGRTVCIPRQLHLAPAHCQTIENKQPADQRLTIIGKNLDRF